ncbi:MULTISPECIES: hypothetical protein [unclassified Streptomyces]|uniref:hypothetical protein n=1 Tax=Streptomyces sp. NBC_00723 TaxID=2903673 RepID=UPI0038652F5F
MDAEVTAALIGGTSGLGGALLGGIAVVWTAKHQGRLALQAALETARATYLGPIDTARRSAQRDVFAGFLTAAQEWTRTAADAADAARRWDETVCRIIEECCNEGFAFREVSVQLQQHLQPRIDRCSAPHPITDAAQHVLLEAATTDVARAAQRVEQHAIRLMRLVHSAGETQLEKDSVSPSDPSNHVPPDPQRSPNQLTALRVSIDAFASAAAAQLNRRDTGDDSEASSSA